MESTITEELNISQDIQEQASCDNTTADIMRTIFLENIGYIYGTCTENADGSFDMTTYGEAKLHYNNASDGLIDWLGYLEDVEADDPDPERAELIRFIQKKCKH